MFLSPGGRGGLGRSGGHADFVNKLLASISAVAFAAALGLAPAAAQGRLTLTSGTAVTTADVTGAATVYYTPCIGRYVPIWDGWRFVMTDVAGELSQATTDTTKSPAAVAANTVYDAFVWSDAGVYRCTRGYAWTSTTSRGTGVGTAQLIQLNGVWVNAVAITNGPAAFMGTYVGTIRADGSSLADDSKSKRNVWNMYNRRPRAMAALESADSWTYTLFAYHQANGNAANQLEFVRGLDEDVAEATVLSMFSSNVAPGNAKVGIGLDSTTVNSATVFGPVGNAAGYPTIATAHYRGCPGLGVHTLVWLELSPPSGTSTWYGVDSSSSYAQNQAGIIATVYA